MPLDYRAAIENQAWSFLQADSTFVAKFSAGRRINMTGDGWLRRHYLRAPGDFPSIAVELRGSLSPAAPPKIFLMNSTGFSSSQCDMSVPLTQQLAIVITYESKKTLDQTPLEADVEAIFWRKYPKFGLSYVVSFVATSSNRKDVNFNGSIRPQTTLLYMFQLRPLLSQLSA